VVIGEEAPEVLTTPLAMGMLRHLGTPASDAPQLAAGHIF